MIIPIATTTVFWDAYIKASEDILGFSPTRGLDDCGIKITSGAAYLATLSLDNKPLENLRNGQNNNNSFSHVSMSFAVDWDEQIIHELCTTTDLTILTRNGKRKDLSVLSGTMSEWFRAVIVGCSLQRSEETRFAMNEILNWFEKLGFREVWSGYEKIHDVMTDTYSLKETK